MNKKLSLLTFVCLIQATLTFSQIKNKGNISLMVGPAFPTGQFAGTNLFDESSGFAKTGTAISLSYTTKPLLNNWAFLINLAAQKNPINTNAFESTLSKAKIYQGFYFGTGTNNPPPQENYSVYPNWKFENKSWLYASLQVGTKGQFSIDKQNKTWLTTNVTVGVLYLKSPQLKGSSITDTASAFISQSKSSGYGLIYSFGVGMNYYLNRTIFLTSTLNYIGTSKVTFKNVEGTLTTTKGTPGSSSYSIQQSTTTANGQQAVSSINLLIGIGIVL
ncbi:MAG: hypothetical protein ABIN67_12700 [Ferruginibacter sp.]